MGGPASTAKTGAVCVWCLAQSHGLRTDLVFLSTAISLQGTKLPAQDALSFLWNTGTHVTLLLLSLEV